MRRHTNALRSLAALLTTVGWISAASADIVTVWCHAALKADGSVYNRCDNDMSGGGGPGTGHMGPDGLGVGHPVTPGEQWTIPDLGGSAMYRLFNFSTTAQLITEDYNEAYNAFDVYGFSFEQVMAHFTDYYGGIPLYRAGKGYDFLYTTDWNECHSYGWYCAENPAGYIYNWPAPGMCKLQRGWRIDNGMHFVSISDYEVGYMDGAIHIDGTLGWVYPAVMGQPCPY